MSRDATAIALAALSVALHNLRIAANRGLVSPNEVESVFSTLMETIEQLGSENLQGNIVTNVGGMMGEIRQTAKERWVGKGKTNPD